MNGNQLITKHSAKFDTVEKSKRPGVLATLRGPVTGWKPNRNGRTYSRDLWVKALNSDYVKEQVALNHFVGEADHPEERLEPVIQNMSHAMRDFEFDDANQEVIATIDILDTPCGNMLKTLYDYSGALSFSTRGSGDVLEDGEVDPETYQLFAIDAVLRPSYATATVRNLLTESESLHKDKDVKKVIESYSGSQVDKKELDESVSWDYYDTFHDINDKYLPSSGEGDNMATQTVTAVNKLIYKWYNDGDVYDNSSPSGLMGWANDLSDYANWLAKNIDGCKEILDRIFEIHYGDNGVYEDLLQDLANNCLDENLLSGLATQPKEGSIYDCSGDYSFDESRNYDEEYDESENLTEATDEEAEKMLSVQRWMERMDFEDRWEPGAGWSEPTFEFMKKQNYNSFIREKRDWVAYKDSSALEDFDRMVKSLNEDSSKLQEAGDTKHGIPDDVKEAVETEVYDDRNIDVRSSMFKGNDFVVEARNELSEDEFTKIVDRIQYHFNNYGIVYDSIEDDGNNVIVIDCSMSASAYEEYKANSDDYTLNDESFTMYNADTDKTVRVHKDGGKWVDEDGNRYMGYLTKSDVKKYFKGNWIEIDESEDITESTQLNEYGDTKDYSEEIQKLFKKWFKENADIWTRGIQWMTDSYFLDIETRDKGEGPERRKLYKVVNNSFFVEVEDWADEIGQYIADSISALKYVKYTFNDSSMFSDDENAGDITWYFVQQIGIPDFGAEFESEDSKGSLLELDSWVDPRSEVSGWKVKVLDVIPDEYAGSTVAKVELFDPNGVSQGEDTTYIHRQDVKIGQTYDAYIDGIMAMPRIKGVKDISSDEVPDMRKVTRDRYLESASDRYQVREFDGPGAKFGVYDTKQKKFIQKGSKKVMIASCDELNKKVNLEEASNVIETFDKSDFNSFCEENFEAINDAYNESKASDLGISVEEYCAMDEPVDAKYWDMIAKDMYEDNNSLFEDVNDSQEYIDKFNELYSKYRVASKEDEEVIKSEVVDLLTNAPVGTALYRLYKDTSSGWTSRGSYSDTRTEIHEYLKSGENEWTINGHKKNDMRDAMLSILYNPGDFMTKEEAEAQKKEQSKNDTSSHREIINVGTDSAGNPVGKSINTVTYPNREVESVDFLDDYFNFHKGNF